MESTTYLTTTPLGINEIFPTTITAWDDAIMYTSYFIQLMASSKMKITIFQSTPVDQTATGGSLPIPL